MAKRKPRNAAVTDELSLSFLAINLDQDPVITCQHCIAHVDLNLHFYVGFTLNEQRIRFLRLVP